MESVLLSIHNKNNQKLLQEFLGDRYAVVCDWESAKDGSFDLCIVDGVCLEKLEPWLRSRKEVEQQVFFPVLLITSLQELGLSSRYLWIVVDEIINAPIQKIELQARVECLLRARRFSLEAENLYKIFAINCPLGLYVAQERKIIFVNPALSVIVGEPAEKILHAPILEFIHPEERTRIGKYYEDRIEGREAPAFYETRIRTARGDRWIELRVVSTQYRRQPAVLGLVEDITERKRLEEQLRESRDLLEQAQRVAHIGNWIVDLKTAALFWSKEVYRIYGVEEDAFDLNKETFFSCIHPQDLELLKKAIDDAKAGKAPLNLDHRIVRPDGTVRWIHAQAEVQRDKEGKPLYHLGTVQDITERKLLEEQFFQAQKMEAIGRLSGGVAHDFNNILMVIKGFSELAMRKIPSGDTILKDLEEVQNAADRAAALTRQLLAFSRKQILVPQIVNLNRLIANLEKMLLRLIGEDIHLSTALHPSLGNIKADPGQIEQIVMNLAVNARDAMPIGGKILIESANTDFGQNTLITHPEMHPGSYAMLAVSDTGCGMSEETMKLIFDPFFTTKELGKGTGLGLATVYGIVKQSGGFIYVSSELGRGTTFKIYFPRVDANDAPTAEERLPGMKLEGSETILLVEDEETLRKLISRILAEYGYRILAAQNGMEAIRIAEEKKHPIHLMITDVVMPGISGKVAAERLQSLFPEMKVLFMSGYTDHAIVHHGILKNGLHFLQKPIMAEELLRKVREMLDAPRPAP